MITRAELLINITVYINSMRLVPLSIVHGATMSYFKNEEQQSEYRGLAGLAGS